ncbi:RimJ/RimL family protein N-acetyltransferase [Metabacillus crassostreae]|uniref:GNAT family N-acetyltransferase n=1 Tax=Metabacillus crassostreae TaxID=929098 RepID=UPI00195C9C8E|nr:GNAT family N-acetyltransferase [Metabacillus crassostreae]MBM7602964.1 RimJ/RimL family protein N-acetyltransferase [Metabacillus crassostreae]
MPQIETERLLMITFTAEMMKALLKSKEDLEAIIPYSVAAEYPLDVYKQFFTYKIERFTMYPPENEWEGCIIHKATNVIMGDMGFKGGPNEAGEIDLGYSIVPSYQGKGFATEMGKAMVKWGISQRNVKCVKATCDTDNIPSKRVLEKIGFQATKKDENKIYWHY